MPIVVRADGTALVTTTEPHRLLAGARIRIDGGVPDVDPPAVSAGDTGEADAAQTTLTTDLTLSGTRSDGAACLLPDGRCLLAGGWNAATATYSTNTFALTLSDAGVIDDGVADGRTRIGYAWAAAAALATASAFHRLTALPGQVGGVLLSGGKNGGGTLATARLFDGTSWSTVPHGTLTARYSHLAIRVEDADGEDVVYFIGGLNAATVAVAAMEVFTSEAGGTLAAFGTEADPRFDSAGCAATANAWVAVGGARFDGVTPVPRHDCLAYDHVMASFVSVGNLAVARMGAGAVQLSSGQVMAVGGKGRVLSKEQTDRALHECEILDLRTGRWRPTGRLNYPRHHADVFVRDGRVYCVGGFDTADARVTVTEVYDSSTGKWAEAPDLADVTLFDGFAACDSEFDGRVYIGGKNGDNTPRADGYLLVPGADVCGVRVAGEFTVGTVQDATSFDIDVPANVCGTLTGAEVEIQAAATGTTLGPYIWDTVDGVALTETETATAEELAEGHQYATLDVDDAIDFPNEVGWLILGFGTSKQVGPIRYLGRITDTKLKLDYTTVMSGDVPSGASVHLLTQRNPFVPADPTAVGSAYLTASSAGRIAAQRTIEAAAAAGFEIRIEVGYPSDVGLGNAGGGSTGQKPSDAVAVWAGDDVDQALADARDE